jgi:tetratricopeptide (TPR) repeat protein
LPLEPDDVYLLLGKAALALGGEHDFALFDAKLSLLKAKAVIEELAAKSKYSSEQFNAVLVELRKLVALQHGLEGDKSEAIDYAKRALEMDPDDERASEILAALNALPDQRQKAETGLALE